VVGAVVQAEVMQALKQIVLLFVAEDQPKAVVVAVQEGKLLPPMLQTQLLALVDHDFQR
jgi:hypothetical protein